MAGSFAAAELEEENAELREENEGYSQGLRQVRVTSSIKGV